MFNDSTRIFTPTFQAHWFSVPQTTGMVSIIQKKENIEFQNVTHLKSVNKMAMYKY